MLARAQQRPAPSARCPAARRAASSASRPARTPRTCRCPTGPTTPSRGAPASRATISATSRSRPKNHSASATSKDASPLNGQHDVGGRCQRARARARACSVRDPAGELALGPSQAVALGRRAIGDRPRACGRRLALTPIRPPRDAPAAASPPLRRPARRSAAWPRLRRIQGGDRGDAVGAERPEHDHARLLAHALRRLADDQEHRRVAFDASPPRGTRRAPAASGTAEAARAPTAPRRLRRRARARPRRCTSAASSATRRVRPIPSAPPTTTSAAPVAGARPRATRARSRASSVVAADERRRGSSSRGSSTRPARRAPRPGAGSPRAARAAPARVRRRSARRAPPAPRR